MRETIYRGRKAAQLENDQVRVTVTVEGGHVAEILHKATQTNPLWTPPWPSIEHSAYTPEEFTEYGDGAEAKLLAGIMGHNVCLDLFGGPSPEEAAAGITVHGEASVNPYTISADSERLRMKTTLEQAGLAFERIVRLENTTIHFQESVENRSAFDRPIAWTQHVTLGPPFLEHAQTKFELTATRSKTYEGEFGDSYPGGAEFEWPLAPARVGGTIDLRTYTKAPSSAGYTAHLMDPRQDRAWFAAYSPSSQVLFGYSWRREDFPWCGVWEENRSRLQPPWKGQTITRGMEFGVSPMPETRRQMIDRNRLFGVPAFRWLPAKSQIVVEYQARITVSDTGNLSSLFEQ